MGTHGQDHVVVVSYSIMDGQPTKDLTNGKVARVIMDIEGASMPTDFKIIEIMDDNNPYPALLGIDWPMDMNGFINLKKRKMIFEKKSLRVIVPLDPAEGKCYTEPIHDEDSDNELDCIYQIIMQDQDWVNPIADERISWECDSSYTLDSNEEIERWQNQLHEVTMVNYNMRIRSQRRMTTEVRILLVEDSATNGEEFVDHWGTTITEQK